MPRPREGIGFVQAGVVRTGVRLRDGKRCTWPVIETDPPPPGVALGIAWAKAVSLARQAAYDNGTWAPTAPAAGLSPPVPPATTAAEPIAAPTVLAHARAWIKTQAYSSASEDRQRIELYLAPDPLAALPLAAAGPRDCAAFVARVRALRSSRDGQPLAARTVRNITDVVRRALAAAVASGALEASPWRLPRGALPAIADKHREFRMAAVFTREEAAALCFDARIPPDRRALYTLLLLTGCRFGEVAALRWRHYDATRAPLGRLVVATSIERRSRAEKTVKSGVAREVPVHPTLAAVLAAWKASGWPAMLRRAPGDEDFLVPSRRDRARGERQAHARLQEDLARLGLRGRRIHDTRRTFVSLCRDDGARGDVLRWVTHGGSKASMVDVYSSLAWPTLCGEVARLRLDPPPQPAPAAAAGGFVTGSVTNEATETDSATISGGGGRIRTPCARSDTTQLLANQSEAPDSDDVNGPREGGFVTGFVTDVTIPIGPLDQWLGTPSATWGWGDRALLTEVGDVH